MTKRSWLPEHDEALELLMGDENNLSFETISQRLTEQFGIPFGRNSCIGRAHRLKMPPRPPRTMAQITGVPAKLLKFRPRIDAPIVPKEARHKSGNRRLTLLQLGHGDCRYPSSEDNPPYTYCGKPTRDGSSFCSECRKICYYEPKQRWS